MDVPAELLSMLSGEQGPTRQKASRLVVDLAVTAGAKQFVRAEHAHVSGVSVITGGHGLRRFLSDLSGDPEGKVTIPTTLNSAGCDHEKMDEMGIDHPNFLEQQFEIVHSYSELGIEATLSCTPYDRGIESEDGIGSWAESNANHQSRVRTLRPRHCPNGVGPIVGPAHGGKQSSKHTSQC